MRKNRFILSIVLALLVLSTQELTIHQNPRSGGRFNKVLNTISHGVFQSYKKSTWGIACVLVENRTGKVIYSIQNRVVRTFPNGQKFYGNPVLHAETQTIRWFWLNKIKLRLSAPQEYTIISSLEPCLKCTGNIAMSGFNVGVVQNDVVAGIGFDKIGDFSRWQKISPQIYHILTQKFGYYKIDKLQDRNQFKGSTNVIFNQQIIPSNLFVKILYYYKKSKKILKDVRNKNSFANMDILKDISLLDEKSHTVVTLKKTFPQALSMKVDFEGLGKGDVLLQLQQLLIKKVDRSKNRTNAIAMVDQYNNLLAVQVDSFEIGPIFTAIFNLQNKYFDMYLQLVEKQSKKSHEYRQSDAYLHLANPSQCRYVVLNAPNLEKVESLQFFGMLKQISHPKLNPIIIYINKQSNMDEQYLDQYVNALPPLYRPIFSPRTFKQSNKRSKNTVRP